MPSYTCLCCGHPEGFDSADAAFQAGWDVAPHFTLQPLCNLCPSSSKDWTAPGHATPSSTPCGTAMGGCRDGLLRAHEEWVNRQIDLAHGRKPFTLENVSPSPGAEQVSAILEVLKRRGLSQENRGKRLLE